MHNPFAPLIAIARRGISFTASRRPSRAFHAIRNRSEAEANYDGPRRPSPTAVSN